MQARYICVACFSHRGPPAATHRSCTSHASCFIREADSTPRRIADAPSTDNTREEVYVSQSWILIPIHSIIVLGPHNTSATHPPQPFLETGMTQTSSTARTAITPGAPSISRSVRRSSRTQRCSKPTAMESSPCSSGTVIPSSVATYYLS